MYSESDIEAAVAAGAITPESAAALRASVAAGRQAPAVDEESFRLVTGFNDIFVSIAAILLLVAVGWIGSNLAAAVIGPALDRGAQPARSLSALSLTGAFGAAGVAAASWLLAEYFTRRRRMALPSILLLASFVLAVAGALGGLLLPAFAAGDEIGPRAGALLAAATAALTAGATLAHWRRFHVPITVAALTLAAAATLLALFFAAVPAAEAAWLWVMLATGLAVFAFAMRWDASDPARVTRRADVAFWLHLAAAPLIAHPVFNLLGVLGGAIGAATALAVLLLYAAFGVVALAVDRRALLVSSLVYVLSALAGLLHRFGAVSIDVALTALVIGSALLLLSAFWQQARRAVVVRLPAELRRRLPLLDRPLSPRPA